MSRLSCVVALLEVIVASSLWSTPVGAQDAPDLTGRWTLNRELSQLRKEVGFSPDWLTTGESQPESSGGGRGRRGSGGGRTAAVPARPESAGDARLVQLLTADVRNPAVRLAIIDTQAALLIEDERGQSRTFHPNGRAEEVPVENLQVGVTATREAGRLTIVYKVEQGRELRYTYSRIANPPQVVVDVQFTGRGGGDRVRLVYEPAKAADADPPRAVASSGAPGGVPASAQRPGQAPAQPAANQRPGAEFKGLTKLGVVVEEFGSQAAACGLNHDTFENAVTKRLSDAGFQVLRNSDEDTYVYVNVSTASVSSGLCVSRYDVFIYTHATATLSYQQTPVLVQVSLLHRGGLAGGGTAAHANDVLRGAMEYLEQFVTRIRDANK